MLNRSPTPTSLDCMITRTDMKGLIFTRKKPLTNLVEKVTYFFQNVTLRSISVVISLRAGGWGGEVITMVPILGFL